MVLLTPSDYSREFGFFKGSVNSSLSGGMWNVVLCAYVCASGCGCVYVYTAAYVKEEREEQEIKNRSDKRPCIPKTLLSTL